MHRWLEETSGQSGLIRTWPISLLCEVCGLPQDENVGMNGLENKYVRGYFKLNITWYVERDLRFTKVVEDPLIKYISSNLN